MYPQNTVSKNAIFDLGPPPTPLRDAMGLKYTKEIGVLMKHQGLWCKLSNNVQEIKHQT